MVRVSDKYMYSGLGFESQLDLGFISVELFLFLTLAAKNKKITSLILCSDTVELSDSTIYLLYQFLIVYITCLHLGIRLSWLEKNLLSAFH